MLMVIKVHTNKVCISFSTTYKGFQEDYGEKGEMKQ